MNKKLLICGAIATGLLLTACVKKETPKDDEQEKVETQQKTEQPAKFENLQSVEQNNQQNDNSVPTRVEVEHQETNNTSTTIRREIRESNSDDAATPVRSHHEQTAQDDSDTKPAKAENVKPKAEVVKAKAESTLHSSDEAAVAKPKPSKVKSAQSEDDAVNAAIAAATPALKN